MTSRQIISNLIKAIKKDDKMKISKLRKEYSKIGYVISDAKLKQMIKKYSLSKSRGMKLRKSRKSRSMKLRKSRKSRGMKLRKSKTLHGGMMKRIYNIIYGDNSLPKASPPLGTGENIHYKPDDDDYLVVSTETESEKQRRQMVAAIITNLSKENLKTFENYDDESFKKRHELLKLAALVDKMNFEDLNKLYIKVVLDKY